MALSNTRSFASSGMRLVAQINGQRISSSLVLRVRSQLRTPTAINTSSYVVPSIRSFSQASPLLKKRKIAPASDSPNASPPQQPPSSATSSRSDQGSGPDPENPLDFSSLAAAYIPIDSHFKSQLQAVLHGGRFNPDVLGSLSIPIKDENGGHTSFPLRELAQVVPRSGRTISLLVNDKEFIKPIMSAVQASKDFNQQPQRSEDNELELLLKVEMERRDELVRRVKDACQGWRDRVRQARTRHEKVLKEWKKNGTVLPDVVKKAEKELQKAQDKKMKEIDAEEAQTVKQLDRK